MSSPEQTRAKAAGAEPAPARPAAAPLPLPRSLKIHERHLGLLAVVYVRQSSPHQVLEHRESRERQYALADYAVALGWPRERVLLIDEDQGHSGLSAAHRTGFQRLLAEVSMGHVGLVLGLEMSRLARSSKDWHHLLEVCAVFGTLLADQDGVYDADDPNDRLLLGLKGTISEVELHTMRNRLERGKLHKAERGELFLRLPLGYVRAADGQAILEPDEQARAVVALVFVKFEELGTLWATFRYLVTNRIRLGIRPHKGPQKGQLQWRRPTLSTLHGLLRHPIYAGAYAYGRRAGKRRPAGGASAAGTAPAAGWRVLLRDRLPAYIPWERYLANQEQLRHNRTRASAVGAPRAGAALLTGLLVCGHCGGKLRAAYRSKHKAYYSCVRHLHEEREQPCHGLPAAPVDDLVAAEVLRALEPAALELSMNAVADIQQERARLDQLWRQRLEGARYQAERAERQYQAVEPENRLVARSLEQRWEEALRQQRLLEEDYDRFVREQAPAVSAAERARIASLAVDIPALWEARETTAADRKEMIRCLVERVVVDVRPESERVGVHVHWHGGCVSRHELARPVQLYEQLGDYAGLRARLLALRREGHTASAIALQLNREGFCTPKLRGRFSGQVVRKLLSRWGLSNEKSYVAQLAANEWWLPDLAAKLAIAEGKLAGWVRRGWVSARKTPAQGWWIVWADRDEMRRLRKLKARSRPGVEPYAAELITPKKEEKR